MKIKGELAKRPWAGPLLALVTVYALFAALRPATFLRPQNLVTMARQTAVVGVAASGMTLLMLLGGIDLSVGSAVALTTVIVASALKSGQGPWAAAFTGVIVASLAGLSAGTLIGRLKISPFIVTLGAMTILRGAAKGLAHEQKIDCDTKGLEALSVPGALGVPPSVLLMIGAALTVAAIVRYTRFGRHVVAIGSNEKTALLAGVNVPLVKTLAYTLGGAFAGLAGVIELSTLTVGDPTDSVGLELEAIAAVVIGGGSLSGGEGSALGALIGGLVMTVIKTGCTHLGLPNWVQELLTGAIIITAVGVDRIRKRAQ